MSDAVLFVVARSDSANKDLTMLTPGTQAILYHEGLYILQHGKFLIIRVEHNDLHVVAALPDVAAIENKGCPY